MAADRPPNRARRVTRVRTTSMSTPTPSTAQSPWLALGAIVVAIAAVGLVWAAVSQTSSDDPPQEDVVPTTIATIELPIVLSQPVAPQPNTARDGDPCTFTIAVGDALTVQSDNHAMVATFTPTAGILEHHTQSDTWTCDVTRSFTVPEATSYTITALDAEPVVVKRQTASGTTPVLVTWPDGEATTSPVASPVASPGASPVASPRS